MFLNSMKIKITKKTILISFLVVALVGLSVTALEKANVIDLFKAKSESNETNSNVDLSPPTDEDKKQAEDNKKRIVEEEDRLAARQENPSLNNITPSITYAGQYGESIEVGAVVQVFEDGGKCTLTLFKDGFSVKKSVDAVKSSRSVDCPVMAVARTEINSIGVWSATVSYESPNFKGISNSRDIEVK